MTRPSPGAAGLSLKEEDVDGQFQNGYKIKALTTVGLFSACSKRELQSVARRYTPFSVEEGFVLTTEGTVGACRPPGIPGAGLVLTRELEGVMR